RDAGDRAHAFANVVAQPPALAGVGHAAVDQHRRRLLAGRPGDGERGDVSGLEPGQLLDRPFNVLRPVIAAVDDDHVLGAADHENIAFGHVAHVAGIEPKIVAEAGLGRFLVAEIAVHHRRAADIDLADPAVGQNFALGVADIDFHAGDRPAAIDDGAIAARPRAFAGLTAGQF